MADGIPYWLATINLFIMRVSLGLRITAVTATLALSPQMIMAQSAVGATAAVDSAKLRLAREVIHASGADSTVVRAIQAAVAAQSVSSSNSNLPAEFWEAFASRARHDVPQLIDSLVPLYATHFSAAELNQLKTFYSSSLGQRLVAEQGPLQQESARLGMRWGAKIGSEIALELMDQKMGKSKSQQP